MEDADLIEKMPDVKLNAQRHGRRARREGLTHLDNPYRPGEHLHEHWLKGWAEAGMGMTRRRRYV